MTITVSFDSSSKSRCEDKFVMAFRYRFDHRGVRELGTCMRGLLPSALKADPIEERTGPKKSCILALKWYRVLEINYVISGLARSLTFVPFEAWTGNSRLVRSADLGLCSIWCPTSN